MARTTALLALAIICAAAAVAQSSRADAAAAAKQAADRVLGLPGQPSAGFEQYAGYVTVNETHGRALFYWFIEAAAGAHKKPLVLWLNGGPGCSSLYGALQELGPFLIQKGKPELHRNPESWNKEANLLFLESTAGVGFSYTNTSQDLDQFGDSLAVEDMHKFLIRWFKRFPNLKGHEFYIAGESYAGHQVSQLADKILAMNKGRHRINLKGIMIGNPSLDRAADDRGIVESAWQWHHAVMSDDMYDNITRACDHFTDDTGEGEVSYQRKGDPCEAALGAFFDTLRDINQYTLYSSTCTNAGAHRRHHGLRYIGYDPCARNYTREYLNRADVQRALHANATRNNARLFDNWRDSPASVLPVIKKLVDAGLRIWLYSGDMDVRVPPSATRYALRKLQLKTLKPWRKWFAGGVVAGDTVVYKGLVYATVRGAGMAVPWFAPVQARKLLSHFLAGRELPTDGIAQLLMFGSTQHCLGPLGLD
ncbi:hypothetical protein EJB05_00967, partial [Eragrostis curvula]